MEILIISGLSGGGKSKAASFLEDSGFYIVDNMPAAMILKFAEFCAGGGGRYARVALVYDVRTAESFSELFDVLDKLKGMEGVCRMLFLEASPAAIIKRYKETRRRHPLEKETDSLEEAVEKERELMLPVKQRAVKPGLRRTASPQPWRGNSPWPPTRHSRPMNMWRAAR